MSYNFFWELINNKRVKQMKAKLSSYKGEGQSEKYDLRTKL